MVQDSTIFSFDSIEDLKQKLQPSTHVQLSPDDVMVWQSAPLFLPSYFGLSPGCASVWAPPSTSAGASDAVRTVQALLSFASVFALHLEVMTLNKHVSPSRHVQCRLRCANAPNGLGLLFDC
jgi:hypothetical protein